MIRIKIDSMDFDNYEGEVQLGDIAETCGSLDEFNEKVTTELRATMLFAIFIVFEAYFKIIQSMCKGRMSEALKASLRSTLLPSVLDISEEEFDDFRKTIQPGMFPHAGTTSGDIE